MSFFSIFAAYFQSMSFWEAVLVYPALVFLTGYIVGFVLACVGVWPNWTHKVFTFLDLMMTQRGFGSYRYVLTTIVCIVFYASFGMWMMVGLCIFESIMTFGFYLISLRRQQNHSAS